MKYLMIAMMALVSLSAEQTQQITPKQASKQPAEEVFDPQWLKERLDFNRAEWDAEEKSIFEAKSKEKQAELKAQGHAESELARKLIVAYANEWATCSMREKFRTQKGSLAIEKSEKHGKEMKEYWDEIYERCRKAKWAYYRLSKAFKAKSKQAE